MNDWSNIKHFKPTEFKYPDKMDSETIYLLDDLRDVFNFPFIVHSDYRPGNGTSQHHHGRAVDFHIAGIDYKDAVDLMMRFLRELDVSGVVGLGIYPHWNSPGFHLDTRGYMARWGAINRNGKQEYVTFNEAYQLIGE